MAWREALMPCGASAALNWSKPSHAQLSPKARNVWGPTAVLRSVLIIAERGGGASGASLPAAGASRAGQPPGDNVVSPGAEALSDQVF